MTNSEYFEKNNVSFADAMKAFNAQKDIMSLSEFLTAEAVEWKFKVGDLVVLQLNENTRRLGWKHNVVFEILHNDNWKNSFCYHIKALTPIAGDDAGSVRTPKKSFVEENCVLY